MNPLVLPHFDIRAYNDAGERAAIARKIDLAARDIGLFAVTGHGLETLFDHCIASARHFFEQPAEHKQKLTVTNLIPPRGYFPHGVFVTNTAETPLATKVRENFVYCMPPSGAKLPAFAHRDAFFPPVDWPVNASTFREDYTAFNDALFGLSRQLWHLFAMALDLPAHYFTDRYHCPTSFVVLNYYKHVPQWTPHHGKFRMGPHTDITSFTMVIPEQGKAGFQVNTAPDTWVDVQVPSQAVIVQIGDLMKIWTNNRWSSTTHRVHAPSDKDTNNSRVSLIYGVQTDPEVEIACLETCTSASHPPAYQPTTCCNHERAAFSRAVSEQVS